MDDFVKTYLARVNASEEARRHHKSQWLINSAYFKGAQWHKWNPELSRFIYVPPYPDWRVRLTMNFVRAIVLTMAAKLTQNRPAWTVMPSSEEENDRNRARVGQKLLDFVWESHDCQDKLFRVVLDSVLTGNGFWCIYWDRDAGKLLIEENPETGATREVGPAGDLKVEVVSPFDIGLDPMADDISQCEWGYRKRIMSVHQVKTMFGKKVDGEDPMSNTDEAQHRKFGAAILGYVEHADEFDKDYVGVYEYYDLRKKMMYWFTREKILGKQKWNEGLPFIHFRAIPNVGDLEWRELGSGGVWGETVISDIIPMQKELNKIESQFIEIKNAIVMPRMLATRAAQINPLDMVQEPGSVVRWSGTGPMPTTLNMGTLPAWAFQMSDRIIQRMYDITGIHEISQGQHPGSIQSGRGLAILAEMDATKFGPWTRNIAKAIRDAGRRTLELYNDYSLAPILLSVVGESGELEVSEFYAGEMDSTDVRVQEGSTFALNKQLRTDQILQLWQFGIIQDPRKILKMLEFATVEEAIGDYSADRLRQRREVAKMLRGEEVRVEEFDEDFVHIDELDRNMKSSSFEEYGPEVQELFRQHRVVHMGRIQQQMMAEQQAARQRGVSAAGAGSPMGSMPTANESGLNPAQEANPGMRAAAIGG